MDETVRIDPMERTEMLSRTVALAAPATHTVSCIPERQVVSAYGEREHLLIRVTGGAGHSRHSSVNICLLVDRSGSMDGAPLEYVKRACEYVVRNMQPQDTLSIVSFAESVDVVMPARRVVNPDLVMQHVNSIITGNTTNIYDGLVLASNQFSADTSSVNRVVLLSDGDPTAGIRDFGTITQQAATMKQKGISVTALGFGPDFNEELLAGIARRSTGTYAYIERADQIPEVFRREVQSAMSVAMQNLQLKVSLSRFTKLRQQPAPGIDLNTRSFSVGLGDVESGQCMSLLLDFEHSMRPAGKFRVAVIEAQYQNPGDMSTQTLSADAVMEFTRDVSRMQQEADPRVKAEIELQTAAKMLERTMMGLKTQQITVGQAQQDIERTMAMVSSAGETERTMQLQQAVQGLRTQSATGGVEKTLMEAVYELESGRRENGSRGA